MNLETLTKMLTVLCNQGYSNAKVYVSVDTADDRVDAVLDTISTDGDPKAGTSNLVITLGSNQ